MLAWTSRTLQVGSHQPEPASLAAAPVDRDPGVGCGLPAHLVGQGSLLRSHRPIGILSNAAVGLAPLTGVEYLPELTSSGRYSTPQPSRRLLSSQVDLRREL
jgi:hypothetical protein